MACVACHCQAISERVTEFVRVAYSCVMNTAMARAATSKNKRPVAATNPNTGVLYARVAPDLLTQIEMWRDELNAAADAAGDLRRWTVSDVVRAVLTRRVREKKPGEQP